MFGNYIYMETNDRTKGILMKTKLFVCAGVIALFAGTIAAAEKQTPKAEPVEPEYTFVKTFVSNADPKKYPDPAKAAELLTQREKLVKSLHDAKRNVIRDDTRARALQKEIRERLEKLTQLVERSESVKRINQQIKSVDEQLKNLTPPEPPEQKEMKPEQKEKKPAPKAKKPQPKKK